MNRQVRARGSERLSTARVVLLSCGAAMLGWAPGNAAVADAAPRRGIPPLIDTAATMLHQPAAVRYNASLKAIEDVPAETAPAVNLIAVTEEDNARATAGLAPRFAIPNPAAITPVTHGTWEQVDRLTSVWRVRVSSPGAVSLNLGFSSYHMPADGLLFIYAPDFSSVVRPFTDADNAAHGELWTPVVPSDELVVEVTVPTASRGDLQLKLASVNVGYTSFGGGGPVESGSCNIDVVCPEGNQWGDEISSVAVISTGGSLFCTGFMVNNTAQDETPLFMTANHCGIRSNNASSLVAYWNYETSSCGGTPDGSLSDFQSGSFFRATYSASDFTIVELDQSPDPAWGVTFAGWDRSGNDTNSAIAIHHPSVDEKRISFENDPTTTTSYLGSNVPGDGTHVRITDWDLGTTEGGSSGSPLFDPNHRVIGQLHGGYAACSNNSDDWYGKISVSWNGGGSSATRLRDWLDPGNTGAVTVNTLVAGGCNNNADCNDGLFCNGSETCVGGTCQAGSDPCPGEDCDEGANVCVPIVCNNNGTCETDENCNNCANDCFSGTGPGCDNGICEPSIGEDCLSCPQDCNGKQNGNPGNRFCCGDGDGAGPVDCSDGRCTSGPFDCSNQPGTASCCGDATCEGTEDASNCAIDCSTGCSVPADCDDGVACTTNDCVGGACVFTSNDSNCPDDGLFCNGAEYCDGTADCSSTGDPCAGGSSCNEATDQCDSCAAGGDSCSANADCCSNKCKGGRCRGN